MQELLKLKDDLTKERDEKLAEVVKVSTHRLQTLILLLLCML